MNKLFTLLIAAAFLLTGCGLMGPVQVSANDLPLHGVDPIQHTVYVGSDEAFHYFRWSHFPKGGEYKVPREEIRFPYEFSRESGRQAFLTRDDHGNVTFHILSRPR